MKVIIAIDSFKGCLTSKGAGSHHQLQNYFHLMFSADF